MHVRVVLEVVGRCDGEGVQAPFVSTAILWNW